MKHRRSPLRIAASVLAPALAFPSLAAALDLRVMVPNLADGERVTIALYDDPDAWKRRGEPARQVVAVASETRAEARFRGLEAGRFAVVAYLDRNGDGRLDTWPWGGAREPAGYSGGKRPWFGPPNWGDADVAVTPDELTTVFVRLK